MCWLWFRVLVASLMLHACCSSVVQGEQGVRSISSSSLGSNSRLLLGTIPFCGLSSLELYEKTDDIGLPCILEDTSSSIVETIDDVNATKTASSSTASATQVVIRVLQLTPTRCRDQRDGTITAAQHIIEDDVPIGFHKNVFIKIRLVSVVVGDDRTLGLALYYARHVEVMQSMVQVLKPHYIVGTCSEFASAEVQPSNGTILLAQVGHNSLTSTQSSEVAHVFGMHVDTRTYPGTAIRDMAFWLPKSRRHLLPVHVIYRNDRAEPYLPVCTAAIEQLESLGFTNLQQHKFNTLEDHDQDGILNVHDTTFMNQIADKACPYAGATSSARNQFSDGDDRTGNNLYAEHPTLFLCTESEHQLLLDRWHDNQCRPTAIWLTTSTITARWAENNLHQIPYFKSGRQWHEALQYSDRYYTTGAELLRQNEERLGYPGTYETVVSYSTISVIMEHLRFVYRIVDDPDPLGDFSDEEGRERLRRYMTVLKADTLFGPVAFNEFQRNVGRDGVATQWLPTVINEDGEPNAIFKNSMVAPFLQAEKASTLPAPSATFCDVGEFANSSWMLEDRSLLNQHCSPCPVNTYAAIRSSDLQCLPCPRGSDTEGRTGQSICVRYDDNLVGLGLRTVSYVGVGLTWIFAVIFMRWVVKHLNDPVVKIGQPEFLFLICIGAMISSSSAIGISIEAGTGEDTTLATLGCRVAPFLYTIGWVLEYASLSVKSYRLYKITSNLTNRKIQVKFYHMLAFIIIVLFIDLVFVVSASITSPLEYKRVVSSRDISESVKTINSDGYCRFGEGNSWFYLGPVITIHAVLMIGTNILLYNVRYVNDRYQEQKHVALASVFACEVLFLGLPVLVAVGNSAAARFIVMTGIVILNDIGILCFVFIPKIFFQKEGLPEGVSIGDSLDPARMRRVMHRRESSRQHSSGVLQANSSRMLSTEIVNSMRGGSSQSIYCQQTWAKGKTEALDSGSSKKEESNNCDDNDDMVDKSVRSVSFDQSNLIKDTTCASHSTLEGNPEQNDQGDDGVDEEVAVHLEKRHLSAPAESAPPGRSLSPIVDEPDLEQNVDKTVLHFENNSSNVDYVAQCIPDGADPSFIYFRDIPDGGEVLAFDEEVRFDGENSSEVGSLFAWAWSGLN